MITQDDKILLGQCLNQIFNNEDLNVLSEDFEKLFSLRVKRLFEVSKKIRDEVLCQKN